MEKYRPFFESAAKQFGEDPLWLEAMAQQESAGNPNALSKKDAAGLMQIIPATAKELGVTNVYDPEQNIMGGTKYYTQQKKKYNDPNLALVAYNWGPKNADNWIRAGGKLEDLPEETRNHIIKVNANYRKLKKPPQETQISQNITPMSNTSQTLEETDPDVLRAQRFLKSRQSAVQPSVEQSPVAVDENIDPDEAIAQRFLKNRETKQQKAAETPPPMGTAEDVLRTIPSSVIKGLGAIPQLLPMGVNALTNTIGYVGGKIMGVSPDVQEKLSNINPLYVGNTPFDAIEQARRAIVTGEDGEANPLTGAILHEPQTTTGRYVNTLTQAAVAGPATGVKLVPSLSGAVGAQVGSEYSPNNPVAPLVGGIVGGVAPSALESIKLRANPSDLAHKVIKEAAGEEINPSGQFSFVGQKPIVPGTSTTLTEATGNPGIANVQRQIEKTPTFIEKENINEAARQNYFGKASGTAQDIDSMKTAREQQRVADTAKIFKPTQKADVTPVVTKIDEILNGPGGERSAVKNTLTKIRDMVAKEDKDGNVVLQSNPEKLYKSVKHEIEDMMDKKNLNYAEGRQASGELKVVKDVLDTVIEEATPGYAKYLKNYSDASSKIDAAQWLQDLKLTDAQGKYTLNKVKNALENAKKQQKARGINEAKHLTNAQMKTLQDLHDDLLRREKPRAEGMSRGSPTSQNLLTSAETNSKLGQINHLIGGQLPEMIGSGVGSTIGAAVGSPGVGAFLGNLGGKISKGARSRRMEAAYNQLENFMLDPELYKQYLLGRANDTYINRLKSNLFVQP